MRRRIVSTIASVWILGACGAKTGLRVPDAHPDVFDGFDAPDVVDIVDRAPDVADVPIDEAGPDVTDACVTGRFELLERSAEVIFVLDRSGSMRFDLQGHDGGTPARWDVLRDALAIALPPFQSRMDMGAFFFPHTIGSDFGHPCDITRSVDVPPARNNVATILATMDSTIPWGATPTFEALRFAGEYLSSRVSLLHQPSLVLATDGGPNCNTTLDPTRCLCTNVDDAGLPTCDGVNTVCLDDVRTVTEVATLAASGVPTYVIGIDDPGHPEYTDTLDRMAIAGGHPRIGVPRYYNIRSADNLVSAFSAIQRSIVQCSFVTPSRPSDPNRIAIEVGDFVEPRDPTHADGWDWSATDFSEITLYGASCDRAVASGRPPVALVTCAAP